MNTTTKIILTGVFILMLVLVGFKLKTKNAAFAQPVGTLETAANLSLQSKIESYMESQKGDSDLGKENYHCGSILYGYDERYAYAWVYCSGFISSDDNLEQGTGFSVPTRLSYDRSDLRVTAFTQPQDGGGHDADTRALFPEKMYRMMPPSSEDVTLLVKSVEAKAEAQISM